LHQEKITDPFIFSILQLANAQFSHDEVVRKSMDLKPAIYLLVSMWKFHIRKRAKCNEPKFLTWFRTVEPFMDLPFLDAIDGKPVVC